MLDGYIFDGVPTFIFEPLPSIFSPVERLETDIPRLLSPGRNIG
jgi:hypothetical protein